MLKYIFLLVTKQAPQNHLKSVSESCEITIHRAEKDGTRTANEADRNRRNLY